MESQNQDSRNQFDKLNFIINGLEGNDAFNKFIDIFKEQADAADECWQMCMIETDKGKESFYALRAHKISLVTIINKLEELKFERDQLQEELKEDNQ